MIYKDYKNIYMWKCKRELERNEKSNEICEYDFFKKDVFAFIK